MYSSMKCYATIHGVIAEKSIFFEQDIVSTNNVIIYSLYDLFQVSVSQGGKAFTAVSTTSPHHYMPIDVLVTSHLVFLNITMMWIRTLPEGKCSLGTEFKRVLL